MKRTVRAILNLFCLAFSIRFLLKRSYGLEDDVWSIPRLLFNAGPFWHLNGIIIAFLFNPSACCLLASFCSRGYMVWKMMMFKEFHHGFLVLGNLWYANGMILGTSESPCYRMLSIKFLLKRIYGLEEDVGWRIPRWLFSARQSLVCKWDNLSYFWVFMMQEASQRVSAQEYIWFGRKCWLKNSKMAV